MIKRGLVLGILLAMLATAGTALAQSFGISPTDRTFKVTWDTTTTKRGQPAIEGYVVNQTGYVYRQIILAVDGTDASGRALATTLIYVNGDVTAFDRLYFKNALPQAGDNYRVTVNSYERANGGGGY